MSITHETDDFQESVILKINDSHFSQDEPVYKLRGLTDARSIFRFINAISLDANPRLAKVGRVTTDIEETLLNNPDRYKDLSKGILIATNDLEPLDRNRWNLFFDDLDLEGVIDGGHNLLSIGRHFIHLACGSSVHKTIKSWEDLKPAIIEHSEKIKEILDDCDFKVPVEIVCPGDSDESRGEWPLNVQLINHARNNNAELKDETKANYSGFFDPWKKIIAPVLHDCVEWKTGLKNRHIKTRDLAMLSLVPLSLISESFGVKIKGNALYSSKAQCLTWYTEIFKHDSVSREDGKNRVLYNPLVESALDRANDMIEIYEHLYQQTPHAYNSLNARFARIGVVRKKETGQKFQPKTKFSKQDCSYAYPDGFIVPLLWGMRELLEVKNDAIDWKVDPTDFISDKLPLVMAVYKPHMGAHNNDPQKVGKDVGSYELCSAMVKAWSVHA
jgi:hypothetical protein